MEAFRKQFNEGKRAFYKNLSCPYPVNTDKNREWVRGYNKAFFENQNDRLGTGSRKVQGSPKAGNDKGGLR